MSLHISGKVQSLCFISANGVMPVRFCFPLISGRTYDNCNSLALEKLLGLIWHCKIVAGVVNRCQQDINNSRSMSDAREAESEFFDSHEEYADVSHQCGTANLAKSLNRILVDHIRGLLPKLRATIEKEMDDRAAELISYGEAPVGDTSAAK